MMQRNSQEWTACEPAFLRFDVAKLVRMDRCESAFSSVVNIEFRPNYPRLFPLTFSRWLEKIALHDNRSLAGGARIPRH
jgi:hypothetical protein